MTALQLVQYLYIYRDKGYHRYLHDAESTKTALFIDFRLIFIFLPENQIARFFVS